MCAGAERRTRYGCEGSVLELDCEPGKENLTQRRQFTKSLYLKVHTKGICGIVLMPLFLFILIFSCTYSPSPHRWSAQWEKPTWDAEPRIGLGACLTASRPSELRRILETPYVLNCFLWVVGRHFWVVDRHLCTVNKVACFNLHDSHRQSKCRTPLPLSPFRHWVDCLGTGWIRGKRCNR